MFNWLQFFYGNAQSRSYIGYLWPQPDKNPYFRLKIRVFPKKKKMSSLGIGLQNSYFYSKIRVFFKKKKGLHLESVCKIPIFAQNHSVLQKKITAACHRQDLCKIVPRAAQISSAGQGLDHTALALTRKLVASPLIFSE